MGKHSKIITFLFIFSLVASLAICLLTGWKSAIAISTVLAYMFTSIFTGAFGAVLLLLKKFIKLSSEHIEFRFFAILFTVSVVIFSGISYFIGSTVTIHFKDGVTEEQVKRAYINTGIAVFMPIKMFVGTFIGMLLAVKNIEIKCDTNEIKLKE